MQVILDTNIYLSGLIFPHSPPAKILELIKIGKIKAYASNFIISELCRILLAKFKYDQQFADKFIDEILQYIEVIAPKKQINLIKTKKDDNRILECAVHIKADFLITGDKKHILPVKKINDTKIVTASEFIKEFKKITSGAKSGTSGKNRL